MVALDCFRGLGAAFDDIGINCSLSKIINSVKLSCLFLKYTDEFFADDAALFFRVINTLKLCEESVNSVNVDKICLEFVTENGNYFLGLALAQKTVVYVNAGKTVANCLDKQRSNNGRVNTARKSKENFAVANLLADTFYLIVNEILGVPGFCA